MSRFGEYLRRQVPMGRDLVQPDKDGIMPTHLPMKTMDNREMMAEFKKALGGTPGAMIGGGWGGSMTGNYRTGPARLSKLQGSYGGTQDSVVWVFACVSLVASTLASYPWRFSDLKGETLENVDASLATLLDYPNPAWTFFDLAEAVVTDCELVGNSYLLKDQVNGLGQPKALYRMDPALVRIAVDSAGIERGYVYTPKSGLSIPYDLDEVIHFKYPSPLDEHYGMGTVEAIVASLDQVVAEGQHITGFFQNGARIAGVLTIPDTLTDTQFERLKQSYTENFVGPANAYKVLVGEGVADYKPISQTPLNSGVVELMKISKDEILAGFGVPAPLLGGLMENANYKMAEAQHIFTRAMIPRARRFAERITVDLARLWGVEFHVDPHANEPLEVRIAQAKEMIGAGASVNEAREAMGLALSDDDNANKLLIPSNVIPLDIAGQPPRPSSSVPAAPELGAGGHPATLADHMAELPAAITSPKALADAIADAIEARMLKRVGDRGGGPDPS